MRSTTPSTNIAQPVLIAHDLEVGYGMRTLLPPANFTIRTGDLWAIVGPNGAGKTTLLRSVLGLLPLRGGHVHWDHGVPAIGYVPQRTALDTGVPARVIDIVRDGLETGWSFAVPWHGSRRAAPVEQAMAQTHVLDLRWQQFGTLSAGQKQRVLMARALVCDPQLLVLDEPTSAMDAEAELAVMTLIEELLEVRSLAVMLVSHHLQVVAQHATHLLLVDKERALLAAGTLPQVAATDACTTRYGPLFARAADRVSP